MSRTESFEKLFGLAPQASAQAPGRVNLLGEHTDYNDGYVLPVAISQQTFISLAVSPDGQYHFASAQFSGTVSFAVGEKTPQGFAQYIAGCIGALSDWLGRQLPPIMALVDSQVPIGAGLSSSAALEVATLRALRNRFELKVDDVELAQIAQEAEVRYVGVRCGIMDQMAASLGAPGKMLWLDTRTLERKLLPLPAGTELLVIDSGVPRALASSGYNQRRAECEAAARALSVRALRDVTDVSLVERLAPPLDRRARHVITENARVLAAMHEADAVSFGRLMNESHASLRDDFEVSTRELDVLVQFLQSHSRAYGARLTGAGFGGACVALVEAGSSDAIKLDVLESYARLGFKGLALT